MSHRRPHQPWRAALALALLAWGCQDENGDDVQSRCLRLLNDQMGMTVLDAKPMGRHWLLGLDDAVALVDLDHGVLTSFAAIPVADHVLRMEASDSSAVVADGEGGVYLVAITPSGGLVESGHVTGIGRASDVSRSGDLLAISTNDQGVLLLDVADPSRPREWSRIVIGDWHVDCIRSVELDGHVLGVLTCNNGLLVYDVADPTAPVLLSTITPGNVYGAFILRSGWLYVEDDVGGRYVLRAWDLRNPAQPVQAGAFRTSPFPVGNLVLVGARLYTLGIARLGFDPTSRLFEFSLENPGQPRLIGMTDLPYPCYGLGANGDYICLGGANYGLPVFTSVCF